jgi:hypothetical protein
MEWIKGIAAFVLFFGFIALAFWKSRGVRRSGDNTHTGQMSDPPDGVY